MPGKIVRGTWEIFKGDSDGLFCFRLRSSYGSLIVESAECYPSREQAMRAIQLVQDVARGAMVVDLTEAG